MEQQENELEQARREIDAVDAGKMWFSFFRRTMDSSAALRRVLMQDLIK